MTRDDRGEATIEVVLLAPLLLAVVSLAAYAGRLTTVRLDLDAAARDSARAATLERTANDAERAADAVLADASGGLRGCGELDIEIDTGDFRPGGSVTATVRCRVDVTDLPLLDRLPGRVLTSSSTSTVDLYRATR